MWIFYRLFLIAVCLGRIFWLYFTSLTSRRRTFGYFLPGPVCLHIK